MTEKRTRLRGPLTEAEKKWQSEFARKVQSLKGRAGMQTPFLDPLQLELARAALQEQPHLAYTVFGGFPAAERTCLRVFPAEQHCTLPEVAALLVTWSGSDEKLSHRDFLGAVLSLGLRRDQVGDILLLPEDRAVIFTVPAQADYICSNLARVKGTAVECSVVDLERLPLPVESGKEISGTVAGVRLDAVISLGFGISRSRAAVLIKGELVKVNWRPVNSPALQLKEGDLVSLQGRGRLEIVALEGETRKGRRRLRLKKIN